MKLPFTKFTLHSDVFQAQTTPSVIAFLRICGSELESLVIHKDIYSDAIYHDQMLENIGLPNLKKLAFHDRRRSNISPDAISQKLLFALISASNDSLQSLTLQFPREPAYEQQAKQEILIKLLKDNPLPNLTCLKLDVLITDEILDTLTEMNLRLKELHFSVGASKFTAACLKRLLQSMQYSLQCLKITDLFRRSEVILDFPSLLHLKTFEIHGFELPAYQVNFPNFSYHLVPNLQKLMLRTWAPTPSWEVFFSSNNVRKSNNNSNKSNTAENASGLYPYLSPCHHEVLVTELSLAMNFDNPLLMKRVAVTFPRLKKLEMYFSRAHVPCLEVVFKELEQLEELRLNQSYLGEISTTCIDDVLTGFTQEECQWILKNKAFSRIDCHQLGGKPGLKNLKSMQILCFRNAVYLTECLNFYHNDFQDLKRLDMINLRHRNLITDVTGYMVFLEMKSLRWLSVGHSEVKYPIMF